MCVCVCVYVNVDVCDVCVCVCVCMRTILQKVRGLWEKIRERVGRAHDCGTRKAHHRQIGACLRETHQSRQLRKLVSLCMTVCDCVSVLANYAVALCVCDICMLLHEACVCA